MTQFEFSTPARTLREAVQSVASSASTDQALPILTVIAISPGADRDVEFAATNRYQLSVSTFIPEVLKMDRRLLVPAKELAKAVAKIGKTRAQDNDVAQVEVNYPFGPNDPILNIRVMSGERPLTMESISCEWDGHIAEYPSVGHIMVTGDRETAPRVGLDPARVAQLAKQAAVVTGKNNPMSMHAGGPQRPVLFAAQNERVNWRGLVMPVRIADIDELTAPYAKVWSHRNERASA